MTRILQFADVHFGAEDPDAIRASREAEEELTPDLILVCGDLTQTGSTSEYEATRDWIRGFSAPVVATPGNHDAPYYSPIERITTPYKRFDDYVRQFCAEAYIDDHVAVMTYNSSRAVQASLDWSTGAVDLEDLSDTIGRFRAEAPDRLHFLACHHPLIYPPESPLDKETDNGPEALKALSDANCDAVLTGHIHMPFVKDREPGETGLLSIGAGTLSTRRRGYVSSFNCLDLDDEGLKVTAIDIENGTATRRASWTKSRDTFA